MGRSKQSPSRKAQANRALADIRDADFDRVVMGIILVGATLVVIHHIPPKSPVSGAPISGAPATALGGVVQ